VAPRTLYDVKTLLGALRVVRAAGVAAAGLVEGGRLGVLEVMRAPA
jgi:hypothetical protein